MNRDYLRHLQFHLGSTAVGASTARGMGPPGTISAAQTFLRNIDLKRFKSRNEAAFGKQLDAATLELKHSLPREARHFGSSRKFMNIYLRNCLYNRYTCSTYSLDRIEPWLEVPLDSHTGRGLKRIAGRGELPRWTTVIGLTEDQSSRFQAYASQLALKEHISRVHLDLKFWRRGT